MTLQNRIKKCAEIAGNGDNLSRISGVPRRTLENYLSGKSEPKAGNLLAISTSTNVSLDWLIAGKGLMCPNDENSNTEFPSIPRYKVAASAGYGTFIDSEDIVDHIPFTAHFLHKRLRRTNTKGLIAIDASGDSMQPSIDDGDLIMIDKHKTILSNAVYAFSYEDALFIKRLNRLPDGIEAISDNKNYPSFIINKAHMSSLKIIGQVVWVGHMM